MSTWKGRWLLAEKLGGRRREVSGGGVQPRGCLDAHIETGPQMEMPTC